MLTAGVALMDKGRFDQQMLIGTAFMFFVKANKREQPVPQIYRLKLLLHLL